MRNAAAKLTFIILTFIVIFINKSHCDIKEDALFKTRPKLKVNVQSCVELVYFQSLVGLRLLLVVYLMN